MLLELFTLAVLSASGNANLCKSDMENFLTDVGKPDIIKGKIKDGKEVWIYKLNNQRVTFTFDNSECNIDHKDYQQYKNEPEGFRDLEWGVEAKKIKRLKLSNKNHHEKTYIREKDSMTIGGSKANQIIYDFYKDKLAHVFIQLQGSSNCERFKDALYERYDSPGKEDSIRGSVLWTGNMTVMMFSENEISQKCSLLMSSKEMMDKKEQDKSAEAIKNSEAGF